MRKRFVGLITLLAMLVSLMPVIPAGAQGTRAGGGGGTSGEWEYTYFSMDGTAGVAVTGYTGSDIDVFIPASLDETAEDGTVITYPVLKVDDYAFRNNTSINSVTLSDSIKIIGESAFEGASNMVCIVTTETLAEIGAGAFKGCAAFNSVVLGDNVTQIGAGAFDGCSELKIYCNDSSYAKQYSIDNNISYVLMTTDAEPETYEQDGITYYIQNGEATLMSGAGAAGDVVIPSTVEGCPVTKINDYAFRESLIASVNMPETIVALGESIFYNCKNLGSVSLPNSIRAISQYCFYGCAFLKSIVIPDNIEELKPGAFFLCESLETVTLPEKLKIIDDAVFSNCKQLKQLDIPDSVISIGGGCFLDSGLETIILPEGLTEISGGLFQNCGALKEVSLPNTIIKIGERSFGDCYSLEEINIPEGMEEIEHGAFSYCSSLKTINIPESMKTIQSAAFNNCKNLTVISMPRNIENLNVDIFGGCPKIILCVYENSYSHTYAEENGINFYLMQEGDKLPEIYIEDGIDYFLADNTATVIGKESDKTGEIVIPESVSGCAVTEIGNEAFSTCSDITSVTLPDTVEKIGQRAFYACEKLTEITISQNLKEIGEMAFSWTGLRSVSLPDSVTKVGVRAFYVAKALTDVRLPADMSVIPEGMFSFCESLESIELPKNLKTIEDEVFTDCSSLKNIVLPETLEYIGNEAFRATALENISLPDSVLYLGNYAFCDCKMLREIKLSSGLTTMNQGMFICCSSLNRVIIPDKVEAIESVLFGNDLAGGVTTVYIPESVTSISDDAFKSFNILCVKENSFAHKFAVDKNIPYYLATDKNDVPELYIQDGIEYYLNNGVAKPMAANESLSGNVIIPEQVNGNIVKEISDNIFKGNLSVTSVTLPASIESIDKRAFAECWNLENMDMSETKITAIKEGTFYGCSALKDISLPQDLQAINDNAFNGALLKNITLPDSVKLLGNYAFTWCGFDNITLPENIETIGGSCFYCCKQLKEITLPQNIKIIESETFLGCENLETVNILGDINKISNDTFNGCINLKNINIPSSIKVIGSTAFADCKSLKNLFLSENIEEVAEGAFNGCPNLILCVHDNSYIQKYAKDNDIPYFIVPQTDNPYFSSGQEITGTVTSLSGAPKANVTVELIDKYKNIRETVTTDETGAYAFTYAEVGAYTIRAADAEGNTGNENICIKRKNAFDVYLTGNTDLTIKDSVTISGSVTNENGAPISGAVISLIDENGLTIAFTQTDDSGRYAVENVPNGTYTLRAEASGGTSAVSELTTLAKNGDIEHNITITQSVSISGKVVDENGDAVVWAEITVVNSEGNIVASLNSDKNGCYSTGSLPTDTYSIAAVLENISSRIEGNTVVDAKQPGSIEAEAIVMTEKAKGTATISGKVIDADRQPRAATVVLKDVFLNEVAVCNTTENGKYNFYDVADGIYSVIADTEDEAGFTVVTVIHGRVFLSITTVIVYKTVTAEAVETLIDALPSPDAQLGQISAERKRIVRAKIAYDALTPMDKRRVSTSALDKLNALIARLTEDNVTVNDSAGNVTVSGLETIWSAEEIENSADAAVVLSITPEEGIAAFADGDEMNDEQLNSQKIADKAAEDGKTIIKSYDISLTKTVGGAKKQIRNIEKDSEGMGSLEITIDIPQASRGHKNYSVIHVHNGQIFTLVDIDDNPDTITFETGKLSEFVLTYDDNDSSGQGPDEDIAYDNASKTATIHSTISTTADVIFAAYSNGVLTDLKVKPQQSIEIGDIPVTAEDFDTTNADEIKIMAWDTLESMKPVFDMLSVPLNAN